MNKVWTGTIDADMISRCKYHGVQPATTYLMPAQRRSIYAGFWNSDERLLLGFRRHFVAFPNVLFTVVGLPPRTSGLLLHAISGENFTTDIACYTLPLPNTYSRGLICLGDYIYHLTNEEMIELFFEASFHDEVLRYSLLFVIPNYDPILVRSMSEWATLSKIIPDAGKYLSMQSWGRNIFPFRDLITYEG